jgi:hypothetical protein
MDMMHVDLHFAPLGLALLLSTGACALRIFYALRPFAAAEKKLPERGAYLAIRGNWFLAAQAISFSAAGGAMAASFCGVSNMVICCMSFPLPGPAGEPETR